MNQLRNGTAYIVGSGIAGLASALYLVRDGKLRGEQVCIFEEGEVFGGSLDASGTVESGYTMRGERMLSPKFDCLFDMLSEIPSYDDPSISARDDIFEFTRQAGWYSTTRLIDRAGRPVDVSSLGLDGPDRLSLLKLMMSREASLGKRRIVDVLPPHFFMTNFWFMWRTMFAFQDWHSAAEMRRYLLRFIHMLPAMAKMNTVHRTRYNQYYSIVLPVQRWLQQRGVRFESRTCVRDMAFHPVPGRHHVSALKLRQCQSEAEIPLQDHDVVIVTAGSMTAGSTFGSMSTPAGLARDEADGAWALWKRIAAGRPGFGHPDVFSSDIDKSKWLSFTVTTRTPRLRQRLETMTGRPYGREGLISFKESNWLMTLKACHHPCYPGQPEDAAVWWGYGLNPDAVGNFVNKKMSDCTGEDILREAFLHLHFEDDLEDLIQHSQAIPCMMPYVTSQFMPRVRGDRPQVIPPGSVNLAFVGQYCEVPDDTVFTVEYSVRSAKIAVKSLLGLPMTIPPVYKGWRNPLVLWRALRESLR
ncbi:MAG: oleate hydratase [Methylacidiphilales bacterium]|nr:oleate hydratase [Candidatus Methylacidiphilales bacterium]